jgi:hypothetical protein
MSRDIGKSSIPRRRLLLSYTELENLIDVAARFAPPKFLRLCAV